MQSGGMRWAAWGYTAILGGLACYAVYAAIYDNATGDLVFGWLGVIGCLAAGVTAAQAAWLARRSGAAWFLLHGLQAILAFLAAIGFAASLPP